MTKAVISREAKRLIEERVKAASKKLAAFTTCRAIFYNIMGSGYSDGATAFRNYVFNLLLENPDITEVETLQKVKEYLKIK